MPTKRGRQRWTSARVDELESPSGASRPAEQLAPQAFVEVSQEGPVALIRPHGKITIAGGDEALRKAVQGVLRSPFPQIALDLSHATTIDSSGVGELVSAFTSAESRGGRLVLSGLPPKVSDILQVTQLITVFKTFASPGAALEDLGATRATREVLLADPAASGPLLSRSLPNLFLVSDTETIEVAPSILAAADSLARVLSREPESIYQLPPRSFEELIAGLIDDMGWEVVLTPQTRDGGRDIIALLNNELGRHLCLIEAKRYAANRKVGVDLVRTLYGTVTHEEATSGLLVTTARFSKEAQAFASQHTNRLGLKDYEDVLQWIRKYCAKRSSPP